MPKLTNKIMDEGTLIFGACYAGNGDSGRIFLRAVFNLSGGLYKRARSEDKTVYGTHYKQYPNFGLVIDTSLNSQEVENGRWNGIYMKDGKFHQFTDVLINKE